MKAKQPVKVFTASHVEEDTDERLHYDDDVSEAPQLEEPKYVPKNLDIGFVIDHESLKKEEVPVLKKALPVPSGMGPISTTRGFYLF